MTAIGFMMGLWASVAAGVAAAVLVVTFLAWTGGTSIKVSDDGVRVGRSLITWPYVGQVSVLDAERTRALLDEDADARAFVVQRSWIKEAVQLVVNDEADAHPYWVFSSRTPAQCVAAIERVRPAEAVDA